MMKNIQLTKGKHAIVDDSDYENLSKFKWHFQARGYAVREHLGKLIYMHRIIAKTPEDLETDHINGNGLDNRRSNLRICTRSQNQRNAKPRSNGSSQHKGVCFHKRDRVWQSQIRIDGKIKYLGSFASENDAANAYNQAASLYFGEYANFGKAA